MADGVFVKGTCFHLFDNITRFLIHAHEAAFRMSRLRVYRIPDESLADCHVPRALLTKIRHLDGDSLVLHRSVKTLHASISFGTITALESLTSDMNSERLPVHVVMVRCPVDGVARSRYSSFATYCARCMRSCQAICLQKLFVVFLRVGLAMEGVSRCVALDTLAHFAQYGPLARQLVVRRVCGENHL